MTNGRSSIDWGNYVQFPRWLTPRFIFSALAKLLETRLGSLLKIVGLSAIAYNSSVTRSIVRFNRESVTCRDNNRPLSKLACSSTPKLPSDHPSASNVPRMKIHDLHRYYNLPPVTNYVINAHKFLHVSAISS